MKRGKPLRRLTPLRATQPLTGRSELHRTPLAAVSPRRRREQRQYTVLRREFLTDNPWCTSPEAIGRAAGCTGTATTIQHLRGRRGARLNDTRWWAASCWECNAFAEDHTGDALACGWLVRIEGAA